MLVLALSLLNPAHAATESTVGDTVFVTRVGVGGAFSFGGQGPSFMKLDSERTYSGPTFTNAGSVSLSFVWRRETWAGNFTQFTAGPLFDEYGFGGCVGYETGLPLGDIVKVGIGGAVMAAAEDERWESFVELHAPSLSLGSYDIMMQFSIEPLIGLGVTQDPDNKPIFSGRSGFRLRVEYLF